MNPNACKQVVSKNGRECVRSGLNVAHVVLFAEPKVFLGVISCERWNGQFCPPMLED